MKRLLFLLLLVSPALFAQTTVNGRVMVGPLASRPTSCAVGDQYNTNDGHGAFLCNPTPNTWQPIGGGGTNYQTIETAGSPLIQEATLNFTNVPCVDNPGNLSTDCTVGNQIILNNGSALPSEPNTNFVPPLMAVDNPGNTRIDVTCPAAVGVGGSHASGCVPDPGASGTSTDYLGRDMGYHTSTSAATVIPAAADAIQFVTAEGNDTNDGLSWGSAKLTIYAAICSLPAGNCSTQTAGHGSVYLTTGVAANTSVANAGIWLMGPNDPNYASVPAGWLKCSGPGCNLNIIGVANSAGGPNGHKPRINLIATGKSTDSNFPGLWISSTATNIYIANLQFATLARSIVLAECSNNLRDGTCGVQDIILDNVGGLNAQTATSGPCETIASNSFWIWHRDFGCAGNYNAPGGVTDDLHAAVLIDASTGPGAGLIYYNDTNFAGGGIKVKSGTSGTQLYAKNITEEGDFTHAIPPVVWFTSWSNANSDSTLENIQEADGGAGSMPAIETDVTSNIYGTVEGPTVLGGSGASGPSTGFNPMGNALSAYAVDPFQQGQSGIFNGHVVGQTDVARRLAGLVPSRFANKGLSSTSSWTVVGNGGTPTFTQGLSDPFGGTGAASVSNSNSSLGTVTTGGAFYTPAAGDWIVIGIWAKGLAQTGDTLSIGCSGAPTLSTSYVYKSFGMIKGDGQWQWMWMANKMAGGSGTNYCNNVKFSDTITPTLYGPVAYLIPAGTLSDNEVLNFANTMNSIDTTCAVGSICNVAGHPVSVDTLNLRYSTFTGSLVPGTLTGNRTYTFPDGTGTVGITTGAWTAGQCATASATTGIYTLGACGSGSGTIVPSPQYSLTYYDQAGSVSHVAGVNPPSSNGINIWTQTVTGGTATAAAPMLPGITGRSVSGASDTILYTDRVNSVTYTNAGTVAVSLPGAGTTNFGSSFCTKIIVKGGNAASKATITPVSGTINGGSSLDILEGQDALVCSFDNSNYIATPHDPPATASTNITLTRSDAGLAFASTAGGGTLTNAANSLPAGQLLAGNTYPDIVKTDLSGDATTSGSAVVTVPKVNGVAYPSSPATNTVPLVTSANTVTYTSSTTTINGQSCAMGSSCNVNSGSTSHGVAVNEGNGSTIASTAVGAQNAILSGVTGADPTYKSLTDLSSETYAGTTTGAVNTLAACPTRTATALTTGMQASFLPNLANTTTTPTFNLCTLGAKTITKAPGISAVASNDLVTTAIANVRYDGTEWQLQNPQTSSGGGGSTAVSSLTAAAASNAIGNGNFPQEQDWAQTTNSQAAQTFSESSAATGGTVTNALALQSELKVSTLSASTATPLYVLQGSVTNTTAYPAFQVATTWNNGSLVGQGVVFRLTDTAHAAGSKIFNIFGGAAGTSSEFSVDTAGGTTIGGVVRVPTVPATGTGTTAIPNTFLNPGASAVTSFNTAGTFLGVNANSGFTGNMLDFHVNGGTSVAALDYQGNLTVNSCSGCGGITVGGGNIPSPISLGTTPAAPIGADAQNVTFQASGSNISAYVNNVLTTAAISRWGSLAWSHANGGINTSGFVTGSGGNVCTTAGDLAATATNPSYKTCGTGASANTTQYLGIANGDTFIGSTSNTTNLHIATFAKMSATTATRAWMAEISDVGTLSNLGTSDSPTGNNVAGIRFSSVAGDTNYMLVLCNAAACNATSTGVSADTNKHRFEVRMNDATGTATGCVDGTCVSSTTDYPNSVATGGFGLGLVLDNTTTTVETLSWSVTTVTTTN